MSATVLGYPRIGPKRELKLATEAFWAGRLPADELLATAARLRGQVWSELAAAGLDTVPSNTFSFYDQVLDTAVLFDSLPERFGPAADGRPSTPETDLARYFAAARGRAGVAPLEMTKWFDTNYHYLVPELGPQTRFRLVGDKPVAEYREAKALGVETRPVVVGPVTFLLLAKAAAGAPEGFRPLDLLDDLVGCYAVLLTQLAAAGTEWVQLDEPALARNLDAAELDAVEATYQRLGALARRPKLLVATYFGDLGPALRRLAATPVDGVGLDFVAGRDNLDRLAAVGGLPGKTLVAGLVDGRNVWRTDLPAALSTCGSLLGLADEVVVSTSCSLLHVPVDLGAESHLDPGLHARLAFARQKVDEVVLLGRALDEGRDAVAGELAAAASRRATTPADFVDDIVRARLTSLGDGVVRTDFGTRAVAQAGLLGLPPLPTTTIGSFPQTDDVRQARAAFKAGSIDEQTYTRRMEAEIDRVIALQEDIGLDVLVHGEPERNDMVQYFAEQLRGYAATEHGWVQSYGTRYVRPPILFGDVSRPEPMTVRWAGYAQSRTSKPVKGMLTGPVTMLAWSFVRDDQPLADTARQVALALRDEVRDLHAAGIRVVQVDEPALRELLPLRREDWREYLDWAVGAFRLATSSVSASTQVHTHMCYSEFGDVVDAIDDLDADVASVEAARSRMELVGDLRRAGYRRGIGPGVYDIHSPRVPSVEEMEQALRLALDAVDPELLWVNPDCGLKTRGYPEVEPALRNMVEAARRVRATLPTRV